ncbi:DUF554 domain-containing protein [Clostridiisalibacter paucivorans]|uniref:DUF554 domain-containing protein n=1 Tax=Clostridiisalibacter paucivorans TaxID=408753 RepID=UPI00047CD215|nr:DUF554 domain-containing protein [Clostridiisalibacter paucivorans]
MTGTVINSVAIILGGFIGLLIKNGLKDRFKTIIMQGISLSVITTGLMGALKSENFLLVIISIVIGSIIGEGINIDNKLNTLGNWLESKFGRRDTEFSKGFVTASLIFCVGAMAIMGALESGLTGSHQTLFVKSALDGVSSIIFASTFGIGVIFSSISVFIYQGVITMLASIIKPFLTPNIINEMSAIGGILIMGIGINVLELKRINVANMLPAIFIPLIYFAIKVFLGL